MELSRGHANWALDIIAALRFDNPDGEALGRLAASRPQWFLDTADRVHVTLPLALRCRDLFPPDARRRLDASLARNALCHKTNLAAYGEIADAFQRCGVPHLLLKGFTQWPWYVDDPRHRCQSDLDIYCPPQSVGQAAGVLRDLGYRTVDWAESQRLDHLPVMIRRTGWKWRGDYFDPDRPPSVELHFRFWDERTEGFSAGDAAAFWRRRANREFAGLEIPALNRADGLRYSAMHLMRHLLRGDLQIRHVYELAHFLERSAAEDAFWDEWARGSVTDRSPMEAIAFRLANVWFGCRMHPIPALLVDQLPAPVDRWFQMFAFSPASGLAKPNKDELWLHLCLVENRFARLQIARRRLLPGRTQRVVLDPHLTQQSNVRLKLRRKLYAGRFLAERIVHHLRTLLPVVRSGFRWWKAGAAAL